MSTYVDPRELLQCWTHDSVPCFQLRDFPFIWSIPSRIVIISSAMVTVSHPGVRRPVRDLMILMAINNRLIHAIVLKHTAECGSKRMCTSDVEVSALHPSFIHDLGNFHIPLIFY